MRGEHDDMAMATRATAHSRGNMVLAAFKRKDGWVSFRAQVENVRRSHFIAFIEVAGKSFCIFFPTFVN